MTDTEKLQTIRAIVLDVDGVLTDGSIMYDHAGQQIMRFHVRDGLAIKQAMRAGYAVGIITARGGRALEHRLAELGVTHIVQQSKDKLQSLEMLCARLECTVQEVAYMGDDLADLKVMTAAGYAMATADAVAEVRELADHVTARLGGTGAVREAIEHLMAGCGLWQDVVDRYRQ